MNETKQEILQNVTGLTLKQLKSIRCFLTDHGARRLRACNPAIRKIRACGGTVEVTRRNMLKFERINGEAVMPKDWLCDAFGYAVTDDPPKLPCPSYSGELMYTWIEKKNRIPCTNCPFNGNLSWDDAALVLKAIVMLASKHEQER